MSAFSSTWLALREPADRAARQTAHAQAELPFQIGTINDVVDLACGSGASFRFLAPLLAPRQHWTCIDHDVSLLAAFADSLHAPARAREDLAAHGARLGVRARAWQATVELHCADLARGITEVALAPGTLLGASALLDLVSAQWLEEVVARCAAARAHVLFALTYDGRIECRPADAFDAELRARINTHQRRDKGFGPALGPAAAECAADLLEAVGLRIATARSDWQLRAGEAQLQHALIDGWIDAAREIEDSPELERWHARRRAEAAAGRLEITVGHRDLFAAPPR